MYLRCLHVCLHGKKLKQIQVLDDGRIPELGKLKAKKGDKARKKEIVERVRNGRNHGTERSVERRQRANIAGQKCCIAQGRRRH